MHPNREVPASFAILPAREGSSAAALALRSVLASSPHETHILAPGAIALPHCGQGIVFSGVGAGDGAVFGGGVTVATGRAAFLTLGAGTAAGAGFGAAISIKLAHFGHLVFLPMAAARTRSFAPHEHEMTILSDGSPLTMSAPFVDFTRRQFSDSWSALLAFENCRYRRTLKSPSYLNTAPQSQGFRSFACAFCVIRSQPTRQLTSASQCHSSRLIFVPFALFVVSNLSL